MEQLSPPLRQRGAVLFVALIVLVLLMLAGVAVVRSMDTSNQIAGNLAFKQAAMQASDRAITDARNFLQNWIVAEQKGNTNKDDAYLSTRAATASSFGPNGIPVGIDWTKVTCTRADGNNGDCTADNGDYRFQFVVERQCSANPDLSNVSDVRAKCAYETNGSSTEIKYRVYIRALGPRKTVAFYEVMLGGPAK